MPRVLPINALMIYLVKKHTREVQDKNYLFDMLWVMGTGKTFTDDNHNATYPRYQEFIKPKKTEPIYNITKADVMARFARLKKRTFDDVMDGILAKL